MIDIIGSTRTLALIRIGLVALLWSRFGSDLILRETLQLDSLFIGLLFFLSTLLMFIGLFTRLATSLAALALLAIYYYLGIHLGIEPLTHHHCYLLVVSTVILSLTPCGRSISCDRWLALRQTCLHGHQPPSESGPLWALLLFKLQLSSIYFWAVYQKVTSGFLSGERLEQIWMYIYFGSDFPTTSLFPLIADMSSYSVGLLESFLVVGFWMKKTRLLAFTLGIAFHLIIYYTHPVSTFSLNMILLYLAFIPAERAHKFIDDIFATSDR